MIPRVENNQKRSQKNQTVTTKEKSVDKDKQTVFQINPTPPPSPTPIAATTPPRYSDVEKAYKDLSNSASYSGDYKKLINSIESYK